MNNLQSFATYVSPAGTIMTDRCTVEGHVLDGDYFENNGALTLLGVTDARGPEAASRPEAPARHHADNQGPGDAETRPAERAGHHLR
jgi:hypothetical protein